MITFDTACAVLGAMPTVDRVSFEVKRGEFFVLIGASGAGKSTAMRMINRFVPASSGEVRLDGRNVADIPVEQLRRGIGYAIQAVGLFPHWTVARNIGAVPRLLGWDRTRENDRVDELLELLRLDPAVVREKYPHQLSGGQMQRVGVARALAARPEVLLMDEPFGALDPVTRGALQSEMRRIQRTLGTTIVFVTHDMTEALLLGDRIALMDRGRLIQVGTPSDFLARPANDMVRDFIGREDLGLRLLSLQTAGARMRAGETALGPSVKETADLREALSAMIENHAETLPVMGEDGRIVGVLHAMDLFR